MIPALCFSPLAGIRTPLTATCSKAQRPDDVGFSPLAGIRTPLTSLQRIADQLRDPRFSPLAGIRTPLTTVTGSCSGSYCRKFQSPGGDSYSSDFAFVKMQWFLLQEVSVPWRGFVLL